MPGHHARRNCFRKALDRRSRSSAPDERPTTLEVTRGRITMKDKRVLEAISKADQLRDLLNTAKANAKA